MVSVMSAPGMPAPVESVTVPAREADVSWAKREPAGERVNNKAAN